MKKIFTVFSLMLMVSLVYAQQDQHNCSSCHSLNKTQVQKVLKPLFKEDFQVLNVSADKLTGFYQVEFLYNKEKGMFFVDYGFKNLLVGFPVPLSELQKMAANNQKGNHNKVNLSEFPLSSALVMGDQKASKKVLVFTDPDCPFCAKLHNELKKFLQQRHDVAFYLVLYPNTALHPESYRKALAVICSKDIALLEKIYDKKSVNLTSCSTNIIENNLAFGQKYGISATPTIVTPEGQILVGYMTAEELSNAIK
jgi:thiol:disulfide interchange protein DsbC